MSESPFPRPPRPPRSPTPPTAASTDTTTPVPDLGDNQATPSTTLRDVTVDATTSMSHWERSDSRHNRTDSAQDSSTSILTMASTDNLMEHCKNSSNSFTATRLPGDWGQGAGDNSSNDDEQKPPHNVALPGVLTKSDTFKDYEEDKLTLLQSCAINTMNMFGTGPFITIPFLLAAWDPAGPHALVGYALSGIVCCCDSMVWGELSSMMPFSGGTYIYLKECYGPNKWGRFMAFMFLWQFMISAPMEIASGFTAMSQYLGYVSGMTLWWQHGLLGCAFCFFTIAILYRDISIVGKTTLVLWAVTLFSIAFTVIAGFSHFDSDNLKIPPGAFSNVGKIAVGIGAGARIGVYDFSGYQDVCQMGDEVKSPRRNLPIACTWTFYVVCVVYFAVYLAILGYLPWQDVVAQLESGANESNYIMAMFCERMISKGFAVFFVIVVTITIFGSCFSLVLGYVNVPFAAARGGYFFSIFGHEHPTKQGLADYTLLTLGTLSALCCFLNLGDLLEVLMVPRLLLQYVAQTVGLMMIRPKYKGMPDVYRMPLYPLPPIICIIGFSYCFFTTDNWIVMGGKPLLEIVIVHAALGVAAFFLWSGRTCTESVLPPNSMKRKDSDLFLGQSEQSPPQWKRVVENPLATDRLSDDDQGL